MSKKRMISRKAAQRFRQQFRGKTTTAKLAKRIKKIEVQNKKQVEYSEATDAGADIFTTPTVVKIFSSSAHVNYCQLSFQLKGLLEVDVEDVDVNHLCRIILLVDRKTQDPSTTATWAEVFDSTDIFTLRKRTEGSVDDAYRFKILFDKIYYVAKVSNGFNKTKVPVDIYKQLGKNGLIAQGTSSGKATNQLYLMFMSTGATGDIDFAYSYRLRYTQDGS